MTTTTSSSSLTSSIHQAILATFAADSLSLGAHWVYDTDAIAKSFNGKVDRLAAPTSNYHPNKSAGDLTHTGDTALQLLSHLASNPTHTLDLPSFLSSWQAAWGGANPPGYLDHATKTLLESMKEGKKGDDAASTDDDLSHSIKAFPLLASYHSDEEALVQAARSFTSAFQRGTQERTTSEFVFRTAYRVLVGRQRPSAAIDAVTAQINDPWLTEHVQKGKASAKADDVSALRSFGEKKEGPGGKVFYPGLSCGVKYAVPAVVHYALKYEDAEDPTQAIVEDVSVGGNSNARSQTVALLLFGYRGTKGFKVEELIRGLKARQQIEDELRKIEKDQA